MRPSRIAFLALFAAAASCAKPPRPPGRPPEPPGASPTVTLKGRAFGARVLATERERRRALDGLGPLEAGTAVLLSWPRERFVKLESKDARASFDALFLDRAGKVVEVRPLKEGDREGVQSGAEVAHALLLAAGQAASLGVRPGDAAGLPPVRPEELPALAIGGATAYVELALTQADREQGLMFRPRMSADDGMLFAYEDEGMRRFWMGNTLIPLDIAFFAGDGTLLNVNETPVYPDPRHPPADYATSDSTGPARFVLEMNLGWFRKKGLLDASGKVKPGLRVAMPPEARKGSFD
jgi:hypothetical protein